MDKITEDNINLVRHLAEHKYNGDFIQASKEVLKLKKERLPTSLKIKLERANKRFIKNHVDKDSPTGHKEKVDKEGCLVHQHIFKSKPKIFKELTKNGEVEKKENLHYCFMCSPHQRKKCMEENAGYYTLRDKMGIHSIPIPNYCQRGEHIHRKPTNHGKWKRHLPNSDMSYKKKIEEWKKKNPDKNYRDEFAICGGLITAADNITNPDSYWYSLLLIPKPKDWQLKTVKYKFDILYNEVLEQIKNTNKQDIKDILSLLKPALDMILVSCGDYPKAVGLLKEFKGIENWRKPYFVTYIPKKGRR